MSLVYVRRVSDTARLPTKGTDHAACFDVYVDLMSPEKQIKVFSKRHEEKTITYSNAQELKKTPKNGVLVLYPDDRALLPLNLIFDIPHGYCIKMYPRSGASFKHGLTLANNVGIIDSDYVDPCFVPIINTSDKNQFVRHGDRLAQIELCEVQTAVEFMENDRVVEQKSDRTGGFGSTGN